MLDLFYPPHCVGCGEMGEWFCEDCLSRVVRVRPPFCLRCGSGVEELDGRLCRRCQSTPLQIDHIRSAVVSEGVLREALHAFKYRGVTALAVPLAGLMAEHWARHPARADVMVPVPLHKSRLRSRGFNQAAYLARELAMCVDLPLDEEVLVRHRRTAAQVDLGAEQRKQNVREAFRCESNGAVERRVLLIDDVCTTGSTLEACAVALQRGGARSVQALTLARAR